MAVPKIGRVRQESMGRCDWPEQSHEQKPPWESVPGRKTWTAMGKLLEASVDNSDHGGKYSEIYLQVPIVNIRENKSCHVSGRGKGKEPCRNTPEPSAPLSRACPHARGRAAPREKENTQLQATPAILSHLRRKEKTGRHLRRSQSRSTGSLKNWDLITGL